MWFLSSGSEGGQFSTEDGFILNESLGFKSLPSRSLRAQLK